MNRISRWIILAWLGTSPYLFASDSQGNALATGCFDRLHSLVEMKRENVERKLRDTAPSDSTIQLSLEPSVTESILQLRLVNGKKTIALAYAQSKNETLRFDIFVSSPYRRLGIYPYLMAVAWQHFPQVTRIPYLASIDISKNTEQFISNLYADPHFFEARRGELTPSWGRGKIMT